MARRLSRSSGLPGFLIILLVTGLLVHPLAAAAAPISGTSYTTDNGSHTLSWPEEWESDMTQSDDFSTTIMLSDQLLIYMVLFIHDDSLGFTTRTVYSAMADALLTSFDSEPVVKLEWQDGESYRAINELDVSGLRYLMYIRVDPAGDVGGPVIQIFATPTDMFQQGLTSTQEEITLDGGTAFADDDPTALVASIESGEAPSASASDSTTSQGEAAPGGSATSRSNTSASAPQPSTTTRPSANDPRGTTGNAGGGGTYTNEDNGYEVAWSDQWQDMAAAESTIGDFSLMLRSNTGTMVSFTGRDTTETNRAAYFDDIIAREQRYPGYVGSVATDDRLLTATWTSDRELAILEYVFIDQDTVVTVMVTITSTQPADIISVVQEISLNGDPLLQGWEDLGL